MRRIGARHARPTMVLGRAVYDSQGRKLFDQGTSLTEDSLTTLAVYGVREVLIEDPRVADVPVQPLVAPEVEAEAVQALQQLLTEYAGDGSIAEPLVEQLRKPIYSMVRELFPEVIGEVNVAGCTSWEESRFVRPVKAAVLALLMGRRVGLGLVELGYLGLASALMDVGLMTPSQEAAPPGPPEASPGFRTHPQRSAAILGLSQRLGPNVVSIVLQHHERWDGSGFPKGLRGGDICLSARILAMADTYYELVSGTGGQRALPPHEAAEFIMAYSGELFDPQLVQLFARQVPLYPTGITVRLSTGEVGIVSDANLGHIGRPVVRILFDASLRPLQHPQDVDLAEKGQQGRLIVQVVDY
ncbi:MAG: putative metal-dependent phosphohydrolase, hd subdomain [Dehalococcoidia bacterium]|nr:putative metal-dependent phosphohydrolase, hd subdomain [Dehalococcoidia bacterium]